VDPARGAAEAGIDPSKVTRVPIQPPDAAAAFASGQIEAWATFLNFFSAQSPRARRSCSTRATSRTMTTCRWSARARPSSRRTRPRFDAFERSNAQLTKAGNADPEKYVNVFQTSGPTALSGPALQAQIESIRTAGIPREATAAGHRRANRVVKLFVDNGVLPKSFDVNAVVFDLQKALKKPVSHDQLDAFDDLEAPEAAARRRFRCLERPFVARAAECDRAHGFFNAFCKSNTTAFTSNDLGRTPLSTRASRPGWPGDVRRRRLPGDPAVRMLSICAWSAGRRAHRAARLEHVHVLLGIGVPGLGELRVDLFERIERGRVLRDDGLARADHRHVVIVLEGRPRTARPSRLETAPLKKFRNVAHASICPDANAAAASGG